jgi:hypothetical protein
MEDPLPGGDPSERECPLPAGGERVAANAIARAA